MKKSWFQHEDGPGPKQFTNTWLLSDHVSLPYLLYHWSRAIFFIVAILQSLIKSSLYFIEKEEPDNVYKYFIYLTNNGRWLAAVAFTLEAVLVSLRYSKERKGTYKECFEEGFKNLPFSHKLLWYLANCNSALSIMITIVYWTLLHNPLRHYLDFENFSGHLFIGLAVILDVFISDRPWRLRHCVHPILFSVIFCIFSLFYYLAGGTNYYKEPYIYSILDWSRPWRTLGIVSLVAATMILMHFFLYCLYRIRLLLKQKYISNRTSEPLALSDLQNLSA